MAMVVLLGVALITTTGAITGSAQAGTLSVDFTAGTPQSGFTAQGNSDTTHTIDTGVTAHVDTSFLTQAVVNRGNSTVVSSGGSAFVADGTNINVLMDDFLYDSFANRFIDIEISGASGPIAFEAWFGDFNGNSSTNVNQSLTVSVDGGTNFGTATIVNGFPVPTSPETPLNLTGIVANGTDDVVIRITEVNGFNQLRINGFALMATPVPEPSTFALAAFGLLGLLAWGRRRRR